MEHRFASRMDGLQASAIREILKFTADPAVISFAAGNPAPEAFPSAAIEEITENILRANPIGALQYSISEGYPALRDTLKADLKARHNIGSEQDELIITSGAQQAIELCCKVLCNPGDTLLCETPSFVGSLNAFKSYEVNLVGIPLEDDGIDVARLEYALEHNERVKALYVIPNFQNPAGVTMSLEKRKRVYELCRDHGVMIIEDNPYGELRYAGTDLPAIKSMDEAGIVCYCGSFSKVLSPGLRVGYLCAPRDVVQKVIICKQVSDVHTNILAQMICDEFMTKYDFAAHLEGLRAIYRKKSSLMLEQMRKKLNPKVTWVEPEGGLFIWCKLPDGVDMQDFCKRAVMNKVAVVPGVAFLPTDSERTQCFRINYSTPTDEQIVKGMEILGELTHEMF
jgi:2-aminoadipate transaminase